MSEYKRCKTCGKEKLLSEFYRQANCLHGRQPRCKACKRLKYLKPAAPPIPGEVWKGVLSFEDTYEVSNLGRVRRVKPGRSTYPGYILRQFVRGGNYKHVQLLSESGPKGFVVQQLVLEAFAGPRPEGQEINHKDGNKLNNRLENLEWVTRAENMRHAYRIGLNPLKHGRKTWSAKLTDALVLKIRASEEDHEVLAQRYGVSVSAIRHVRTGRTWKHLL